MAHAHPAFVSLLVIAVVAFAVPLLLSLIPRQPVPAIVGEIAAGIALGTSGADWISPGPTVDFLFLFGLAFLLMLAGLEIDVPALVGSLRRTDSSGPLQSPLVIALLGMCLRLVIGIAGVALLAALGFVDNVLLIGILLTSTSLGIVLAVLQERGMVRTPLGQVIITSAAVADIVTVLLLSIFFSIEQRTVGAQVVVIAVIVASGIAAYLGVRLLTRPRWMQRRIDRLAGHTVRIRLRGSLALLLVFVGLTSELGVESILGAFMAGLLLTILSPGARGELLREQLGMIGFSFFIPAFFVLAGARLDIGKLLENGEDLALVPILLILVFVTKGATAFLVRLGGIGWRESFAAGALQSAQLTLTIAGVEIGNELGIISESLGAALVIVAVLSVLVAPLVFAVLVRREETPDAA